MFPFRKSCELSFQVHGNQDDQMMDAATTSNPAKATADYKRKRGVERDCTAAGGEGGGGGLGGGVEEMKKIQHRDNERQRRVVMAGLLNTLRSLLPLEMVKGKRSVSDHLAETTNFIKHLQNNISKLQDKRERLTCTLQTNSACTPSSKEDASSSKAHCNVSISKSIIGLDIQISTEDGFRLSNPLKVLLEEGMSVVCIVSSKVNGIFHHNIQCQVSDDDIDIQRLQQRLYDVVSSNGSSSSMCTNAT